MKAKFERTGSCTRSLSVINGMYPQVSCNHAMRSAGHQERELIAKERKYAEDRKFRRLITLEFSERVVKLLEDKGNRNADGVARVLAGVGKGGTLDGGSGFRATIGEITGFSWSNVESA